MESDRSQQEGLATKFQRFIDKKQIHPKCPICNNSDWFIDPEAEISIPTTRSLFEGNVRLASHQSMYFLYCSNCGFVAQHMKHIVDQALEEPQGE